MRHQYYYLALSISLVLMLGACKKDTFKAKTEFAPSVASLQIIEPEPIVAGENGSFPVIASTNGAPFTKFSVDHLSDFEGSTVQTTVLVPDDITVDANGNFSRPASTIVLKYPMKATTKGGDILKARFNFTDQTGKTISTEASKLVVNFRTNNTKRYFYSTTPWYNFNTGTSYSKVSIFTAAEDIRNNLEVYWVMKTGQVHYMCSPNSDETAASFAGDARYVRDNMHHTRFIKLENIQITDVNDEVLEGMNFTNSTDVIELENNGLYGVLLQDGRKAVVFATKYSATIYQLISVYQVNP